MMCNVSLNFAVMAVGGIRHYVLLIILGVKLLGIEIVC
jgi:hypothetical protein